jgi:hypothetical protein
LGNYFDKLLSIYEHHTKTEYEKTEYALLFVLGDDEDSFKEMLIIITNLIRRKARMIYILIAGLTY